MPISGHVGAGKIIAQADKINMYITSKHTDGSRTNTYFDPQLNATIRETGDKITEERPTWHISANNKPIMDLSMNYCKVSQPNAKRQQHQFHAVMHSPEGRTFLYAFAQKIHATTHSSYRVELQNAAKGINSSSPEFAPDHIFEAQHQTRILEKKRADVIEKARYDAHIKLMMEAQSRMSRSSSQDYSENYSYNSNPYHAQTQRYSEAGHSTTSRELFFNSHPDLSPDHPEYNSPYPGD